MNGLDRPFKRPRTETANHKDNTTPDELASPPTVLLPNYEPSGVRLAGAPLGGLATSPSSPFPRRVLRWHPQPGVLPQSLLHDIVDGNIENGTFPLQLLLEVLLGDLIQVQELLRNLSPELRDVVRKRRVELLPRRISLAVTKDGALQGKPISLLGQAVWMLGRDRRLADIPLDHLSCSSQHAVIANVLLFEYDDDSEDDAMSLEQQVQKLLQRLPQLSDDDLSSMFDVVPMLWDCGSSNGTAVGGVAVKGGEKGRVLRVGDVLTFGCSTRKYVLIKQ